MKRTVSAIEARRNLGELLEGVHYRGDEIIVERAGKPMAVLVPTHLYEAMRRSRDELFEVIDKIRERNKDLPPEQADELALEAVRTVRRKAKTDRKRQQSA